MAGTIEFEIKARADDQEALAALLPATMPALEKTSQLDVYYDTSGRSLYERGMFLRVRNMKILELKAAPVSAGTDHFWCGELPAQVENDPTGIGAIAAAIGAQMNRERVRCETMPDLIQAFALEVFVEIRKTRVTYHLDDADIAVDDVQGLGRFIEIEVYDSAKRDYYRDLAATVGLIHLPVGYVELLLREKEPATYRRGRYLLAEDRSVDVNRGPDDA